MARYYTDSGLSWLGPPYTDEEIEEIERTLYKPPIAMYRARPAAPQTAATPPAAAGSAPAEPHPSSGRRRAGRNPAKGGGQ